MQRFQQPWRWCCLLVLAGFALGLAGCASPHYAAQLFLSAPNQQQTFLPDKYVNRMYLGIFQTNHPGRSLTVPVGPPIAQLSLQILPPADYHVQFLTRVETNRAGKKNFVMTMQTETNQLVPVALPVKGIIVLLHGYITQKEAMLPWALELSQAGWQVVMVDIRAHGHSTGEHFYAGKVEAVDLIQVLDYLQYHQLCGTNIGVLGYSFGADLALYWAARDPRVKSVVSIAAYNHPEAAVPRFAKEMHIPISEPVINQALVLVADQLGIPWSVLSAEAAVPKITAPILFIGATGDTISPPADLVALKKAAAPGCRALMVDGLKHEMIGYDFAHLAQPVRQWFEQTLTVAAP